MSKVAARHLWIIAREFIRTVTKWSPGMADDKVIEILFSDEAFEDGWKKCTTAGLSAKGENP